jgi:SH3 domain protein
VSENFEITMRTGPGTDRKIISLVQSGKALEVLEKGEEWSMVRTLNGKEGWVLNRYLTASQPCAMVLDRVRQDYDVLAAKFEDLKENLTTSMRRKKRPMPIFPRIEGPRPTQHRLRNAEKRVL